MQASSLNRSEHRVEIDSSVIAQNYRALRGLVGSRTKMLAIVKANAYGYGIVKFASLMQQLGVDWMGVGSMQEARTLREQGIRTPILVLVGAIDAVFLQEAIDLDVTVTIASDEGIEAVASLTPDEQQKLSAHLKIDSGMHRQGFLFSDIEQVLSRLRSLQIPLNIIAGVYTHFGAAEDPGDRTATETQIASFEEVVRKLQGAGLQPLVHAATTTSTLIYPHARYDMIRVGAGLYGIWPSEESRKAFESSLLIKPALSWKTAINDVKRIQSGCKIGYDFTGSVQRDSKIAVLPVGYWHGYRRSLSNVGHVLIRGQRAPIVGRVAMYITAVDVTDIPDAGVGDEVTLVGRDGGEEITLEQVGTWAGTLNKDIVCGIHPDVSRKYI